MFPSLGRPGTDPGGVIAIRGVLEVPVRIGGQVCEERAGIEADERR